MIALNLPKVNIEKVHIRPARGYDLAAMEWNGEFSKYRRIYAAAFERMKRLMSVVWVADYSPYGLIGQCMVEFTGAREELADGKTTAYLHGFRIKPQFRRAGVGTRLLQSAEQDLLSRNFEWLTLTVAVENYPAQRLYELYGYENIGNEEGCWSYIDHTGNRQQVHEPAYIYKKRLDG